MNPSKRKLILVGYWLGPSAPGWPDVRDFVDPSWDNAERRAVLDWLRAGESFLHMWGYSRCRFCDILNGTRELTDGVYVWPEGLAHYIFAHEVRLPRPVVDRALLGVPVNRKSIERAIGPVRLWEPSLRDGTSWSSQRPDWK